MLSDEEKRAIKNLRLNVTNVGFSVYDGTTSLFKMRDIQIVLNLIEKQSKEIEELKQNIHLKEVYVLKTNDYIKGTNVEDELCNKKWKDKIKAKIEDLKENSNGDDFNLTNVIMLFKSLLEKE